ncbi:synaptic vesicle 2-related protein-like [Achroia grisella]|uniref:synaptic vesicle 2-related protein-like n=1 Tax=Achroia grisella TaxID=688607 RepID=UPI0027D20410|nr:synaptic vesicle 2-related protein-like [Achroia grisella]
MGRDAEIRSRGHSEVMETKSYGYDEAVELTGHGWYNLYALTTCCVIIHGVSLDMFGFSLVVAASKCDLQLNLTEIGLLASAPFAGIVFAFPWGYYSDTRGRKRALMVSAIGGFVLSALSSFSPSWQVMLVLKIFGCSFSSASYTLTMIFLGESTINQHRSRYMFILNAFNLATELVSFALAFLMLPLDISIPMPWLGIDFRSWRLFTLIMAVPLGIGAIMLIYLQESPKYLANNGEFDEALRVLKIMHKANTGNKTDYPVKQLFIKDVRNNDRSFWRSLVEQTVPLFKPPLLCTTIFLCYLIAICMSSNNVFFMWYPTMVNMFFNSFSNDTNDSSSFCDRITGAILTSDVAVDAPCDATISENTLYSGMVYGLIYISLTLISAQLATYRRTVLVVTLVVAVVCCILVNAVNQPIVNMIAFILLQDTVVGLGGVMGYFVDLYPTSYRGMAMNLAVMFARLTALGGVNLVGAVIVENCSLTFYLWSCFVFSGVVGALVFLPPDKRTIKS